MSSVSKATVIVAFYQLLHRFRCKLLFSGTIVSMENRRLAALLNHSFRSSRPELFCKKGVLKYFAKFTGDSQETPVLFYEFCKISKNNFFYRTPPVVASESFHYECFPRSFQKTEQFFYRKAVGDFSESRGEELGNSTRQHIFWIFVGTYIKFHKLF